MFKPNKYYNWYCQLIKLAQSKKRRKQKGVYDYDSHHIIPRSMGGSNEKLNLVLLTPREHFIAHLLLVRCVDEENVFRMVHALIRFKNQAQTSRKFELFKKTISNYSKGSLNASFGKMWCYMKDDIENIIYIKKEEFDSNIMIKGLPYQKGGNHNKKWIKKGNEQLSVSKDEVEQYLKDGWVLGRNTKMNLEHMKKMSQVRHTIEKDKAHAEKMREYHKNNPREPKAWINDSVQNKLVDLQELDYYLKLNWKRGRYK